MVVIDVRLRSLGWNGRTGELNETYKEVLKRNIVRNYEMIVTKYE